MKKPKFREDGKTDSYFDLSEYFEWLTLKQMEEENGRRDRKDDESIR